MEKNSSTTQQNILEAGKREFLEKGFQGASLRRIVREAGVTTGAFYGYYRSKEELFDALVGETYQTILERYRKAQQDFAALPPQEQPDCMEEISGDCMDWMIDYMHSHLDASKLLLTCAEGTRYENFVHDMVEIEVDYTHRFMDVLVRLGCPVTPMDPQLEHILVSGMFSAFFEIIIHDMPREQAHRYIQELRTFYTAGWKSMMGF